MPPAGPRRPALTVALAMVKVGVIAFGGPVTHVAFMRRELVESRGWLDEKTFRRIFAACNLIPGPSSTGLAVFIGYRLPAAVVMVTSFLNLLRPLPCQHAP